MLLDPQFCGCLGAWMDIPKKHTAWSSHLTESNINPVAKFLLCIPKLQYPNFHILPEIFFLNKFLYAHPAAMENPARAVDEDKLK